MKARALVAAATVATVVLAVAPARAITYGEPDDGRHPYVGSVVVRLDGHVAQWCSGTLIDADTFLTAAHCTIEDDGTRFEPDEVWVTFDERVNGEATLIDVRRVVAHPDYTYAQNDTRDIAVLELARALGRDPARLPAAGLYTRLAERGALGGRRFTAVGYGLEERVHEPGGGEPTFSGGDTRRLARETFRSIRRSWLVLSMNPAREDGGGCYGDSGGPNFLGGPSSDLLAGLTITGDAVCRATNVVYRLDTPVARAFLASYVDLP